MSVGAPLDFDSSTRILARAVRPTPLASSRCALSLPSAGLLLATAMATSGCASANYAPVITPAGEYRDAHDLGDRAESYSWAQVDDVRVFLDSLPEGVQLHDGKIAVDPARYEVLGEVSAAPKGSGFARMNVWFYDYPEDESWRKGLCYWQTPLVWVTLGIYLFVSPINYPCWVVDGSSASAIEDRKHRIIETLRTGTKALGGNMLVVTGLGSTTYVAAGTSQVLGGVEMTHGAGIALRAKSAGP